LDECNSLNKNKKLAPNWSGPFLITKVRDNGNIRIQLVKKEINVNVNRIKPFFAPNPDPQRPTQQQHQIPPPEPQMATEQKEEEKSWIKVKTKQKPTQKAPTPEVPKRGRGRPIKHMEPPKDKVI